MVLFWYRQRSLYLDRGSVQEEASFELTQLDTAWAAWFLGFSELTGSQCPVLSMFRLLLMAV